MSWNPQDPNQASQYGGYSPQQPNPSDPYSGQYGQQSGQYGQQSGYGQQQQYDPNAYQQPNYGQQQQQQQYSYQAPYGAAGATGGPGAASDALGPTSMGMQANVAAGLSYVLTWLTGIIFFFVEKQNRFVRFNALQSILFFGGITVLDIVLSIAGGFLGNFIGLLFSCVLGLLGLVAFVGWIVLMINAFQGKYFKLPIVGDYAERYINTGKF